MKPRLTRSLQRLIAVVVVCSTFAQADNLTWNGESSANIWNTQTTDTPWLNGSEAAPFSNGDSVTFKAPSAPVTNTVQVGEDLVADDVMVNGDYTFQTTAESSLSGDFSGSGTMSKSGEYLLTLQTGDSNSVSGPALAIREGNLALGGTSMFRSLSSMNEGTMLDVLDGADITLRDGATGEDVAVQGILRLGRAESSLRSVNGSGLLRVAEEGSLALAADSAIGSLSNFGSISAAGNLLVEKYVHTGGVLSATRLILNNGGSFTTLRTDNLVIGSDISKETPAVTTTTLAALSGTDMTIDVARAVRGSGDYLIVSAEDMGEGSFTLSQETIDLYRSSGYMTDLNRTDDGLVLTLDSFNDGFFRRNVLSSNGHAGAKLLDQAFADLDPQEYRSAHPDLASVMDAMEAYIAEGNFRATDSLAANVAGAGLANLNVAWRGQMERQLRAIRNRMTSFQGGMPCYPPDPKAPLADPVRYTLWANAEIDYSNQHSENRLPGYKLHSIGGTAGAAMLAAHDLTIGAAFTGMAGRLSSKGYGTNASGDLDAYYANFFMRHDSGCWQQSLIGTVGWADFSFKRHVGVPGAGYSTRGTTDGLGLGIMYEVARTYKISEDTMKSAWWQPVFNVAYIHSKVDGYTETGSDAALRVGKQDSNNVVFGFGARMQAVVGEDFMNTPAIMEARILGKAIAGGRRGKASVSIPGVDTSSVVRGSEPSAMGIELGIGLNIPLGANYGGIMVDFTAEFYENESSVNGVLGYRLDF